MNVFQNNNYIKFKQKKQKKNQNNLKMYKNIKYKLNN